MLPRVGRPRREAGQRRAIAGLDASTFSAGIRLLPSDLQHDVPQLYQMLRMVDDLVDERNPEASSQVQAIERWAQGQPSDSPEVSILNELSRRHALPKSALDEFCRGMRHDLAQTPIMTEEDLEHYCQHVGGSIGAVVAGMLGISGPEALPKVAMLGRAFQRTNILRDIDEDHAHGRLYIAATTIERFVANPRGARAAATRPDRPRRPVVRGRTRCHYPARPRAAGDGRLDSPIQRDPAPDRARWLRTPTRPRCRTRVAGTHAHRPRRGCWG